MRLAKPKQRPKKPLRLASPFRPHLRHHRRQSDPPHRPPYAVPMADGAAVKAVKVAKVIDQDALYPFLKGHKELIGLSWRSWPNAPSMPG